MNRFRVTWAGMIALAACALAGCRQGREAQHSATEAPGAPAFAVLHLKVDT